MILAICYFLIGSISIVIAIVFRSLGIYDNILFVLGGLVYLLDIFMVFLGLYSEGKGKLIILGNKLVRNELKPAEFLLCYESLTSSADLVIKKPSIDVFLLIAIAYDSLGERENVLATVDEMIVIASQKRKAFANLVKCSFLYSYEHVEEAEQIFNEVRKQKLRAL